MDQLTWGGLDDIAPFLTLEQYLYLAAIGALYFLLQNAILHVIIKILYPKYSKLSTHDIHEYRSQWNAFVHATLATAFSIYCMFWTCGNGKTFFNDEQCREVPRNSHVWTCYFTASYLLVDTFNLVILCGIETAIDKQTLLHHLIAFSNYYLAFWQQGFPVSIGAMFIFLEISTPFVCLRWLYFHHDLKGSMI